MVEGCYCLKMERIPCFPGVPEDSDSNCRRILQGHRLKDQLSSVVFLVWLIFLIIDWPMETLLTCTPPWVPAECILCTLSLRIDEHGRYQLGAKLHGPSMVHMHHGGKIFFLVVN